jgi:hypothetical protein
MFVKEDVLESMGVTIESILKESAKNLIELRNRVRPVNDELALQVLELAQKINDVAVRTPMTCKLGRPIEPILNRLSPIRENLKTVSEVIASEFTQNTEEYVIASEAVKLVESVPEIGVLYNQTREM